MAISVAARIAELNSLLDCAQLSVSRLDSLNGARNPFDSVAEIASLNDWLKRALVQTDKLSKHYGAQMKRKAGAK